MELHTYCVMVMTLFTASIQVIIAPGYNNNMYKSTNNGYRNGHNNNGQARYGQGTGFNTYRGNRYGSTSGNAPYPVAKSTNYHNQNNYGGIRYGSHSGNVHFPAVKNNKNPNYMNANTKFGHDHGKK